jgi:ribonuclease P protein component
VLSARRSRAGRFTVLHAVPRSSRTDAGDGARDAVPVDAARVAVVASRKVGTAVARNRAKRLLREAARATSWSPGVDAVLIARAACAASGRVAVVDEVADLALALGVARRDGRPS